MHGAGATVSPATAEEARAAGASRLGQRILLASLAALFLATLFCGWYFRDAGGEAAAAPPPSLPAALWVVGLLLLPLSWCAERARRAPAEGRKLLLLASLALALLFLGGQAWNWNALLAAETGSGVHPLYAFNFYLMTVLHALHVVGGVVYTGVALASLGAGEAAVGARLANHAGYWHFLLGVWVVVLLNLLGMRIRVPEESVLAPASVAVAGLLALGCLAYQFATVRLLWRRGEKLSAGFALFLPMAYLHVWARAEELGTARMALRWGTLLLMLLVALMFAGTLNLGRFAASYEEIPVG